MCEYLLDDSDYMFSVPAKYFIEDAHTQHGYSEGACHSTLFTTEDQQANLRGTRTGVQSSRFHDAVARNVWK